MCYESSIRKHVDRAQHCVSIFLHWKNSYMLTYNSYMEYSYIENVAKIF